MITPQVFAYYFPDWHADARNADWFGEGWTEWELVRSARPRFPGHRQPRVPTLGHVDEADPRQFDRQTALAAAHGVDGFLFDFYWYDDGPYLQRALDDGFLRSSLRSRLKFALMWANHALVDIFPSQTPGSPGRQLKAGALDRTAFEAMARHLTATYFSEPEYLVIDGRPWLSVYEIGSLVAGLGGVAATRRARARLSDHGLGSGAPARVRGLRGVRPAAADPVPSQRDGRLGLVTADRAGSALRERRLSLDDHRRPGAGAVRRGGCGTPSPSWTGIRARTR